MEQVQVLAENHITAARTPDSEKVLGLADEPQKSKSMIESIPFTQLTHLFHGLYRTGKPDTGVNPFRKGFENQLGFDDAVMGMIEDMKRDILDDGEYLKNSSEVWVTLTSSVDAVVEEGRSEKEEGPENKSTKGSGYLISRFLERFLDLDNRT